MLDGSTPDSTYDVADSPLSLAELSAGARLVYGDPFRTELLSALKEVFAANARALQGPDALSPGNVVWFWPYDLLAGVLVAVPEAAARVHAIVADTLSSDAAAAARWAESLGRARTRMVP